jgi:RND family efflux transporter MFP subunit
VEAKVSGRVEKMPVITGQTVKKGDLLTQLDAREIQARLDQATAIRDQADADLQRFSSLLKQEAVTRAEYDAVQARQRVAQAAVTEADTQLAHTRVLAPFDGVITRKHADVGDLAAPGRPLLEIDDPSQLRLEANISEALIGRVRSGNTLRVRIDTIHQDLEGAVAEVAPNADPNSRTFLVKIDLPAHPDLRAGQFGRVAISVGQFAALRVPASAIVKRGQLEIAFVARDGKAQLRLVKTGKLLGDEIEILSGIDPNESVIIDELPRLLDGQPVEIVD